MVALRTPSHVQVAMDPKEATEAEALEGANVGRKALHTPYEPC